MAEFRISSVFQITNRGVYISGRILEGEIAIGDLLNLPIGNSLIQLKVLSIEDIREVNNPGEIGLSLGKLNDEEKNGLSTLIGQKVEIRSDD